MKTCTKCKIEKPLNEFNFRKESKDNLTSWCKFCISKKNKIWAKLNKDYLSEKRKSQRNENPEKFKKQFTNWYKKNNESQKNKAMEYRKNNPEKIKIYNKKYSTERRKNDINFRILTMLRNRIKNVIKRQNGEKAFSVIELTGCTVSELKNHLEFKFKKGMNFKNYGEWHIDHIIPCSKFDLTKPEEQKKCFHYSNLQPLWASENIKKGNKIL